MTLHSYSSIFQLGHRAVVDLLKQPVLIEEKVDGSQFSFGVYGPEREFRCRSKGAVIVPQAPPNLFSSAVQYALSIKDKLVLNATYRGEVLSKPKHNVLIYGRVPKHNVIIWDIDLGLETYLAHDLKKIEAERLDLETVPVLYTGNIESPAHLRTFLMNESMLGSQRVEGVVVKPLAYNLFGPDKKLLVAKLVSEDFKEVASATWKKEHGTPTQKDVITTLAAMYATPARWQKAQIHLKEANLLIGDVKDIAALIREVPEDVTKECAEEIKQRLWDWAWPQLRRALVRGLPEWYKEQLVKANFGE